MNCKVVFFIITQFVVLSFQMLEDDEKCQSLSCLVLNNPSQPKDIQFIFRETTETRKYSYFRG